MHRFVHAQALDVWPIENRAALPGHLGHIHQRCEFDKLCLARWIHPFDQFAQREADPGYDDRPTLYATMTVNALFWRRHLDDCVDIEFLLLFDQAIDLDFPRTGTEIFGSI